MQVTLPAGLATEAGLPSQIWHDNFRVVVRHGQQPVGAVGSTIIKAVNVLAANCLGLPGRLAQEGAPALAMPAGLSFFQAKPTPGGALLLSYMMDGRRRKEGCLLVRKEKTYKAVVLVSRKAAGHRRTVVPLSSTWALRSSGVHEETREPVQKARHGSVVEYGGPVIMDWHRLCCWLTRGPPPDDGSTDAAHSCDVPNCGEPSHLGWQPHGDNVQRGWDASRNRKRRRVARG